MYKCLVCVTLLLQLLQSAQCLFAGDNCVADNQPGNCRLLEECPSLLNEIQSAGAPMPVRLRRKLQALGCGFQSDNPLVCCATSSEPSFQNWTPSTHGMGGGNLNPEIPKPVTTIDSPPTNNHNSGTDIRQNNNQKGTDPSTPPDVRNHRNLHLLPSRNCGPIENDDKIFGGTRTNLYEMPWMVLIAYDSARGTKLSCGGTLINSRYVLTAAHCVSFLGNRLTLSGVVLGEYDVRKDPDCERVEGELHCAPNIRNVTIEKVTAHTGYSPQNLVDDIALIRLTEPAEFTLDNMKPICLPTTPELQEGLQAGDNGIVAGWGATEDGLQSPVLLSVALPIVGNKECQDAYNGTPRIYNRQMCAGGVQDKDSCGGDSGGPLMYPGRTSSGTLGYIQHGIVSYGSKRCGIGGFPGVYTRVAYYMDWILDNIRE